MISLRRAGERYHEPGRKRDVWHTFQSGQRGRQEPTGFGDLDHLDEGRLRPGGSVPHESGHDAEIITYVRDGAVAYENSLGGSASLQAGEFQQRTVARGVRHSETNVSRVHGAHVFQIWLRAPEGAETRHEQKRFSTAERRGILCVVASPDGRKGSLRIHQDALMHAAVLEPGQHVVHALAEGRSAWLHLVEGEAALGDLVLRTGDAVGITEDRAVSITAREPTELLLVNLRQPGG